MGAGRNEWNSRAVFFFFFDHPFSESPERKNGKVVKQTGVGIRGKIFRKVLKIQHK